MKTQTLEELEKVCSALYLELEAGLAEDIHVKLRELFNQAIQQAGEVAVEEYKEKVIEKIKKRRGEVNIFDTGTGNMFMEDITNLLKEK